LRAFSSEPNSQRHRERERMRNHRALLTTALPVFLLCFFFGFKFDRCDALYGASSPVLQLNPSNFKSKV